MPAVIPDQRRQRVAIDPDQPSPCEARRARNPPPAGGQGGTWIVAFGHRERHFLARSTGTSLDGRHRPQFWKKILPPTAEETRFCAVYGADIGTEFMTLADQYKRRAAECVRMAERTDNAEDKTMLLQMAQTWMRLAEKAEDGRDPK